MNEKNFVYEDKESKKAWSDKAQIHLVKINHKNDLENFLDSNLKIAQAKKNSSITEKNSTFIVRDLVSSNISIPLQKNNFSEKELTGLIGEIISEKFLIDTDVGNEFYIKWKEKGTSNSQGIDIILRKNLTLPINESKHSHKQIATSGNHENLLSGIINDAFKQNSEYHTVLNLARLYLKFYKAIPVLDASGSDSTDMQDKANFVRSIIQSGAFITNMTMVIDDKFKINSNLLSQLIDFNSFPAFRNTITSFILNIDSLQTITKKMIEEYTK